MVLNYCNKPKPITTKTTALHDTIYKLDTIIRKIENKRVVIKTKLDTAYKILYVPRNVIIKDTVLCDSLYSLTMLQKSMISNDSALIVTLNKEKVIFKKIDSLQNKSNKKYWRGFKHGFITGFAGGLLIPK